MNLLDRLLGHDLATTRELLGLCLPLTDEQMDGDMDAGWRTLRRTFDHMIFNIEVWTDLMMERPVRPTSSEVSVQGLLARLKASYSEFAAFARQIEADGRLDDLWTDMLDKPPTQKSFGGGIGHVITHNMHHRAELLHMMQRLGMTNLPEGDLMGWDQRTRLGT
ncbi:MAG: DinB family protein [Chloroflexota bacterium]